MKILWCVTGAGQFLSESVEALDQCSKDCQVTVVLSGAGHEVCRMYGLLPELERRFEPVYESGQGASSPVVGRLSQKEYDIVVVSPCTANTCAKIVCGIADSLVSNIVAQAGKCGVPVYVLTTDALKHQKTKIPVTIDQGKCKRCNACNALRVCPNDAVYVTDKAHINLMLCDACLKCVSSCGNKAVEFGKEIDIKCRDVDIKNAEKLSSLEGITVLDSPSQLVKLFVRKK